MRMMPDECEKKISKSKVLYLPRGFCISKAAFLCATMYQKILNIVEGSFITSTSVDDTSMLFRSRLLRCWSTAGQSPFRESAKTRFKSSHLRIDGGVLVSKSTLEPRRGWIWATAESVPGLGGLSDGRRLEGLDPGPPFGIAKAPEKLISSSPQRALTFY